MIGKYFLLVHNFLFIVLVVSFERVRSFKTQWMFKFSMTFDILFLFLLPLVARRLESRWWYPRPWQALTFNLVPRVWAMVPQENCRHGILQISASFRERWILSHDSTYTEHVGRMNHTTRLKQHEWKRGMSGLKAEAYRLRADIPF